MPEIQTLLRSVGKKLRLVAVLDVVTLQVMLGSVYVVAAETEGLQKDPVGTVKVKLDNLRRGSLD